MLRIISKPYKNRMVLKHSLEKSHGLVSQFCQVIQIIFLARSYGTRSFVGVE